MYNHCNIFGFQPHVLSPGFRHGAKVNVSHARFLFLSSKRGLYRVDAYSYRLTPFLSNRLTFCYYDIVIGISYAVHTTSCQPVQYFIYYQTLHLRRTNTALRCSTGGSTFNSLFAYYRCLSRLHGDDSLVTLTSPVTWWLVVTYVVHFESLGSSIRSKKFGKFWNQNLNRSVTVNTQFFQYPFFDKLQFQNGVADCSGCPERLTTIEQYKRKSRTYYKRWRKARIYVIPNYFNFEVSRTRGQNFEIVIKTTRRILKSFQKFKPVEIS